MECNVWMPAVLLSLYLSNHVLTEQLPNCKDRPLYIQRVSLHSRVSISCPNMIGEDLSFHLSLNQSLDHTTMLKSNQIHTSSNQADTWAQFYLVDQNLNQNLTNPYVFTVNNTGLYTCIAERMRSPPYQEDSVHTLLIEEKRCLTPRDPLANQDQDSLANQNCAEVPKPLRLWLLLVGCGFLLYSIIITIIAIVLWRKMKMEVSVQSDYMNMKPGEKTRPKRVQHPVTGRF
ncbi:uncharacterized protein LOC115155418 [Salmo trutta]|uniref:Uncharacterized LOC115155418 n=1 Tax=Salmo trutta TaxID=8032 RepID=A0A673ZEX9_SALTR|nr:uncharacterized protein LOC115155418 [Salmo trutta]